MFREKGDTLVFSGKSVQEDRYGSLDSVISIGQSCYILQDGILYCCESDGAAFTDIAASFSLDRSYDPLCSI